MPRFFLVVLLMSSFLATNVQSAHRHKYSAASWKIFKKSSKKRPVKSKSLKPQMSEARCHADSLLCETYCLNNPGDQFCRERFAFLYNESTKWTGALGAQRERERQEAERKKREAAERKRSEEERIARKKQERENEQERVVEERQVVPKFSPASFQEWVPDVMTQPVPPGASQTRLQLPASLNSLLITIGAFGSHQGGHPEGLDHEWIAIKNDAPIGSWGDGEVVFVKTDFGRDDIWRIAVDHGDGLVGEFMEIKTPLVKVGDKIKAGDPIGWGNTQWQPSGYQSVEFNLTDQHRRDGVRSYTAEGVFVSPFDYLRDDIKQELVSKFTREIIEPFIAQGRSIETVSLWEPYLTNRLLFHKMYKGTLMGEWVLKSKPWGADGVADILTFLPPSKYHSQSRFMGGEDAEGPYVFDGVWEVDYQNKQFKLTTIDRGIHFGIFELDESGDRAVLKIEYQADSYPAGFSDKALIYVERANVGRGDDGRALGVKIGF